MSTRFNANRELYNIGEYWSASNNNSNVTCKGHFDTNCGFTFDNKYMDPIDNCSLFASIRCILNVSEEQFLSTY